MDYTTQKSRSVSCLHERKNTHQQITTLMKNNESGEENQINDLFKMLIDREIDLDTFKKTVSKKLETAKFNEEELKNYYLKSEILCSHMHYYLFSDGVMIMLITEKLSGNLEYVPANDKKFAVID